ncbi:MAG: DUF6134 family protein [Gemmataceae bacterium]
MTDGYRLGLIGLALYGMLATAQVSRAADIETRDFAVFVGGKAAGEVHMTIHKQDATTTTVRTDTDIKVHHGLILYKYSYRGLEVWKDRRLVRLESTTDDNSKRFAVSAASDGKEIKVKTNGIEIGTKPETWSSTYWTLPELKLRENNLTILDADNGKLIEAKLSYVATEKHKIAGQEVSLNHYRLSGQLNVDLWYDGHDRLVRQEWTEQGHKAILILVRVRR